MIMLSAAEQLFVVHIAMAEQCRLNSRSPVRPWLSYILLLLEITSKRKTSNSS